MNLKSVVRLAKLAGATAVGTAGGEISLSDWAKAAPKSVAWVFDEDERSDSSLRGEIRIEGGGRGDVFEVFRYGLGNRGRSAVAKRVASRMLKRGRG